MKNYKVTKEEIKTLENIFDCSIVENIVNPEYPNYPHIFLIKYSKHKNRFFTIKLPKKKTIDKAYLSERIAIKISSSYKNIRALTSKLDLEGDIYFTSFGFSYDCWFKSKETFDRDIRKLQRSLDNLNIEYRNEYSDAFWVYRFRISKKKENLDRLKQIKEKIKQ